MRALFFLSLSLSVDGPVCVCLFVCLLVSFLFSFAYWVLVEMRYCLVDIIRLDSTVNVVLCEVNYRKNYRLARACVCLTRYPFFCFIRQILPEFNALRCLIDQWISFVVSFQVEWIKIQAHVYIYLSISVSSVCRCVCVCVCARFFVWISYFLIISHQLNWWELYAQIEINQSGIFQVALRLSLSFVDLLLLLNTNQILQEKRFAPSHKTALQGSLRWIRCFWALSSRQVRVASLHCTFVTAGTFDEPDAFGFDGAWQEKSCCRRPHSRRTYQIRLNRTTDIIVHVEVVFDTVPIGYRVAFCMYRVCKLDVSDSTANRRHAESPWLPMESTAEKQKRFWPICWAFDVKWARKVKMVASKGSCWIEVVKRPVGLTLMMLVTDALAHCTRKRIRVS